MLRGGLGGGAHRKLVQEREKRNKEKLRALLIIVNDCMYLCMYIYYGHTHGKSKDQSTK